ncbi:MAG TPA: type VII secretion protein EccB [Streptosporangiaceae bacterium]|nr:type VII secretion protein EccB [Streptosporangiaceae bacterium]
MPAMQSRRDLLQAHRLMTQRAALALLQAEPDPPDRPLRRLNVGVISSVLVAVIVTAAFGVWGLLSPGNAQGLKAAGTLIVDNTGTSYVWCQHGKLCPTVNYASARLALGTASPNQRTVTQKSLMQFPRGPLIGIPGLPEPLPPSTMLVGQPWSVCVQTVTDQATLGHSLRTTVVGGRRVGGKALAGNSALLVQSVSQDWLLWHGQRLPIPPAIQQNVLTALAAARQPAQVPVSWLNAFSQGPAFAPPHILGFGHRVRGPGGGRARIGQVFSTSQAGAGPGQDYVLLRDGLAPVTQTEAALLNAQRGQVPPAPVSSAAVAAHRAPGGMISGGLPQVRPPLVGYDPSAPLCVVYPGRASGTGGGQLTVGGTVPSGGLPAGSGSHTDITLPAGSAALVGVLPAPSVAGPSSGAGGPMVTSYFLVTGGRRYGLASPGVAAILGYRLGAQRTLVPASVIDLIPQGAALDPAAARQQVSG